MTKTNITAGRWQVEGRKIAQSAVDKARGAVIHSGEEG